MGGKARDGRSGAWIGKTIAGLTASWERAIFTEEHARRPGLLQSLDPRVKLASTLLLLLAAGLVHHLWVLVVLYALTLVLAHLSRLPFGFFVQRVWVGVPFFAGLVALPALFLLPGRPLLSIGEVAGVRLAITDQSISSVALFVGRVGTSVSLAMLLVLTTRWADLLKAMRSLGLPEAFVVVLGMTYRYLFVFLRVANDLFLGRASRTVGPMAAGEQRRWIGNSLGVLVGKSFKLSTDVHLAMQARGFAGEVRTLSSFRARDEDWLALGMALCLAAGLLLVDRGLL